MTAYNDVYTHIHIHTHIYINTYSNITYPCGWLGATGGRSYFANRNNYLDSGHKTYSDFEY